MVLPVVCGGDGSVDRSVEDLERAVDDVELVRLQPGEQLSKLAEVEFAEALEQRHRFGGRGHDDLAPIVRIVMPSQQAEFDQTVGQATGGRRSDAKSDSKLRHPQLTGSHHHIQDLGLRHRDPDLGELRDVALDEPMHQRVVALDDSVDGGWCGSSVCIS